MKDAPFRRVHSQNEHSPEEFSSSLSVQRTHKCNATMHKLFLCLTLRTCGQAGLDNSDDDDTPAPHTHASTGDAEVASRVRVQRHRAETSPIGLPVRRASPPRSTRMAPGTLRVVARTDGARVVGSWFQASIELQHEGSATEPVWVDWLAAQLCGFCSRCDEQPMTQQVARSSSALQDETKDRIAGRDCVLCSPPHVLAANECLEPGQTKWCVFP